MNNKKNRRGGQHCYSPTKLHWSTVYQRWAHRQLLTDQCVGEYITGGHIGSYSPISVLWSISEVGTQAPQLLTYQCAVEYIRGGHIGSYSPISEQWSISVVGIQAATHLFVYCGVYQRWTHRQLLTYQYTVEFIRGVHIGSYSPISLQWSISEVGTQAATHLQFAVEYIRGGHKGSYSPISVLWSISEVGTQAATQLLVCSGVCQRWAH